MCELSDTAVVNRRTEFNHLPTDMVHSVASFLSVEELTQTTQVSKLWRGWLQQVATKRSIEQFLLRFTTQQLVTSPSHTDVFYLRQLAPGVYRCRIYDSHYDHFFLTLDTYPAFLQAHEDTEAGMFELGVVHTPEASWRGMISFERFMN